MNDVKLLIGGAACPASNGATFERKSPVSGEVVSVVAAATLADVDAAVAAAATEIIAVTGSLDGADDLRAPLLKSAICWTM